MARIEQYNLHAFAVLGALVANMLLQSGCIPIHLHTQEFGPGQNNLGGKQLYFIPTPGVDGYQRMVSDITELGNDPKGDTVADVSSGPVPVELGANAINFYGALYDTIYIGANGTIGFGAPGNNGNLSAHFMRPQVSLLPVDAGGAPLGSVTYDIVDFDSIAVTFSGVQAGGAPATAQAEFILRPAEYGDIALTYLEISRDAAGVVGLSRGYSRDEIHIILSSFATQAPLATEVMTGTIPGDV